MFSFLIGLSQEPQTSQLYKDLKLADSLLFERTFNRCDFSMLENIVHKELQFLHDQGGMQNRDEFFKAIRENICGNPNRKPIRKLVEGSILVYPLKKDGVLYGAIQTGDHEFYILEKDKPLQITARAKFTHTWLLVNGQWKLYYVLSFDHQPATAAANKK